ncbi:MAG: hypothetical protein ACN4GM_16905 [Gammaproteobacteria bacterium]
MKYHVFSKYIIQFTAVISLVYALFGIVLAILSISSLGHLETMNFTESLIEQQMEKASELDKEQVMEILSKMPEVVISFEFKAFYWSMITLGIIINLLLLYISYQLLKLKHQYIGWFIGLMAFCISYLYGTPMLAASESSLGLAFGAAWGIGNMGIVLLLYTHFWLWAPLLLLAAIIAHYKSHNKSPNQSDANNGPSA